MKRRALSRCTPHLCLALFVILETADQAAFAGAWPKPPGETELIVTASHVLAHREFNATGNAVSRPRFRKIELEAYLEHGLTEDLTLVGKLARSSEQTKVFNLTFTDTQFRRLELGARYFVYEWESQETLYSVEPIIGLHLATESNDPVASRSGDVDFELAVTIGRPFSLFGWQGFSDTRTAYRYRPGNRPAEVRADVTLGVRPVEDWLVMLKSANHQSFGTSIPRGGHTRHARMDLSVVHQVVPELSIEVGAFRSLHGVNTLKETGLKLGFWYHF